MFLDSRRDYRRDAVERNSSSSRPSSNSSTRPSSSSNSIRPRESQYRRDRQNRINDSRMRNDNDSDKMAADSRNKDNGNRDNESRMRNAHANDKTSKFDGRNGRSKDYANPDGNDSRSDYADKRARDASETRRKSYNNGDVGGKNEQQSSRPHFNVSSLIKGVILSL